jgi:hypothetical protein
VWRVKKTLFAVDFHDFYCQHFFGFHTYKAIIMLESFTLMSSTNFVVYLILGAQCWKESMLVA